MANQDLEDAYYEHPKVPQDGKHQDEHVTEAANELQDTTNLVSDPQDHDDANMYYNGSTDEEAYETDNDPNETDEGNDPEEIHDQDEHLQGNYDANEDVKVQAENKNHVKVQD